MPVHRVCFSVRNVQGVGAVRVISALWVMGSVHHALEHVLPLSLGGLVVSYSGPPEFGRRGRCGSERRQHRHASRGAMVEWTSAWSLWLCFSVSSRIQVRLMFHTLLRSNGHPRTFKSRYLNFHSPPSPPSFAHPVVLPLDVLLSLPSHSTGLATAPMTTTALTRPTATRAPTP